jgi:chaperonin cofactor prefoldin
MRRLLCLGGEVVSEKLERREFLKPLNIQSLYTEQRIDVLEQRISDVNDAALYDYSQLEERIEALERRIKQLEDHDLDTAIRVSNMERKLNHKGGDE